MAGIQLSGLASGFDWQSLVDKLIEVERIPQTRLRTEQTLGTQKSTALTGLNTRLLALQEAIKPLAGDSGDIFAVRTASLGSSTSSWSASAAAGAEAGSYTFDITQLATKAQRLGTLEAGGNLSATADVSGVTIGTMPLASTVTAGDFTVNGARISVAATDSLQDVFDRISTATGGAVTASYDPGTDKVKLSSASEIVLGSANDTSNFLSALQLHNNGTGDVLSPKALGVVSVSSAISNANLRTPVTGVDGSGNGTFQINGVDIAYNANTDSVQTVLARINSSSAGVTASFDRVNDRFTLTNKNTGDVGISVSEAPGGLLSSLGLMGGATLARGKNAEFSVDGGPTLISASNTLGDSVHGITGLSVTAKTQASETVTVGSDSAGARAKIDDFIAKYNAVQTYIEEQTKSATSGDGKVTTATLTGNQEVTGIGSSLRSKIFASVPGLTGTISRLESIGIDFKSGTSELEVKDGSKLDAALRTNPTDVRTLFSSKPDGLVARLDSYISRTTGSSGSIATQTASLTKQSKSIDEQIAAMERRIASQKELLTQNFIKMEEAQSMIQSQLTALNNAFGTSS
jgi:flagellar hook-associated protein 2